MDGWMDGWGGWGEKKKDAPNSSSDAAGLISDNELPNLLFAPAIRRWSVWWRLFRGKLWNIRCRWAADMLVCGRCGGNRPAGLLSAARRGLLGWKRKKKGIKKNTRPCVRYCNVSRMCRLKYQKVEKRSMKSTKCCICVFISLICRPNIKVQSLFYPASSYLNDPNLN